MTRSNYLFAAIAIARRTGGRMVIMKMPSLHGLPWSLLPHFGVEVRPGVVVHFKAADQSDFPLWFRGKVRRDWCGEP